MSNATTRELLRLVAKEYARELIAVTAPFIGFAVVHWYAMRRIKAL